MNKFRANLHPAFFMVNPDTSDKSPEPANEQQETIEAVQRFRKEEKVLQSNIRRNNEAFASWVEKVDLATDKELDKQLKQLAKNKKIDFSWTDNAWKCSRSEKRLATSSAKVFQQLLEHRNLKTIIEKCKSQKWELTETEAESWKKELQINSKTKDIQKFYKSFQEYQNPQSKFQHLKNLMWFFIENNFENIKDVKTALETRSQKITKSDIEKWAKVLYQENNGIIIDNKTGQKIDHRPKDWKERASFEVIKYRLNKWEMSKTDKMLTLLWDFNLDGEVNSGDVWYKTWSQFVDVFRRTVATENLKNKNFNDNKAIKNLVDYANKFGMDIQGVQTVDQLYQWMTNDKWYENTKSLQNFLKNLPIELWDVLTNGANAWAQSLENITSALRLEKKEEEAAKKTAEEKAKKIVSAWEKRLKEVIKDDRERANITQQLLTQLPAILLDKAKWTKENWFGFGYGMPLDQIIKWMSAGFNVWIGTDWKPKFWLFVWWDRKFDLSKTTDLRTAVSAGTKLLFVPCFAASMELGQEVNKKNRESSLDAKGEHRVTLWWNVTAVPWIFSGGFSAWYENNKQRGIEKQAQNINNVLKNQAKPWIEGLKNLKPEEGAKEVTFEQKKGALKAILEKEFKNSSPETLETAANNLLSIIQWFKIDEKSTEDDFDMYAQIIADVYSEQWRNAALAWIADNKRKISWWKVGIQFIEWCVPLVTLVAKFTKYRNARTNETEHSRVARIDAQVNGVGNGKNILEKLKVKEIWAEQVKQINEILKRYGAKSWLSYIAWKDGKPWKIQVPVYIADGIWINVRVAKDLEDKKCVDYIKNEGTNEIISYIFPANATYRLLQETGWNQRSLTLNIGSDKSATSDIMISNVKWMEKLLGNNELISGKKWEYVWEFEDKWSIEYRPDFIEQLFTEGVIEWLKTIDSSDRKTFSEFMRNKTAANGEFDKSVTKLTEILERTNSVLYKDIIDELKKPHKDNNKIIKDVAVKKQLIIDRIMAISAYTNVHDKNWLELNIWQRWERYKESGNRALKGPNWQSIFDKLSNRDRNEFVNDIKNYEPVFMPDIIWVTAFYHKNNTARWLALTWLGTTYVLWWKTENLTWDDYNEADRWFLGWTNEEWKNVTWALSEKSPQERENIMRCVKKELPEGANLTEENLKDLLKWEEIELTLDKLTLDKPGKKIKVKVDKEYVRYLMWECANESIGMRLKIKIKEQIQKDDYKQWALYLNNGDGSNAVNVSRKDFAAGISFGGQKKKEKEEEKEEPKQDTTTDPTEKARDKKNDETSDPWHVDNGAVNTWTPSTWWTWNSWSQSGDRTLWESDPTPTQTTEWQGQNWWWWGGGRDAD